MGFKKDGKATSLGVVKQPQLAIVNEEPAKKEEPKKEIAVPNEK